MHSSSALCCLGALLSVTAFGPSVRPTGASRITKRAAASTFHAEGDLSGGYRLSGVWKLERKPSDPAPAVPIQPGALAWSGDRWASEKRPRSNVLALVTLDSAGGFESPAGASEPIRGKWSMDQDEVTLARFGNHGNHVIETWTGTYSSAKNRVKGTMLEGASEPEYAGKFTMKPAFPSLQPVVANEQKNETGPSFEVKNLVGAYTLEFRGSEGISAYDIVMHANRTWYTTADMGNGARLGGTWNVFADSVDLASGIDGRGPRVWLWLRRFGVARSSGVHLTHDRLYLGRISPVSGDASRVRRVAGQVAIGWSTEPAFIGSFRLRPHFGEGAPGPDA